jgi:beta-galactosidase/beta-glucuronidase
MELNKDKTAESFLTASRNVAVNRLPVHAMGQVTIPGMDAEHSLDGEWDFRCAHSAEEEFGAWSKVYVPGFVRWQNGEKCTLEANSEYDPVGEARRTFTLPDKWQTCFLRLSGTNCCGALWCNDVFIGAVTRGFVTSEYDLSAAVRPGENTLTFRVWRVDTDHESAEGGMYRSVTLFTKPALHLEDFSVRQKLRVDHSTAMVCFSCRLSGWENGGTISVAFAGMTEHAAVAERVELMFVLREPQLWSLSEPNFYEAGVFLRGGENAPLMETIGFCVGLHDDEQQLWQEARLGA